MFKDRGSPNNEKKFQIELFQINIKNVKSWLRNLLTKRKLKELHRVTKMKTPGRQHCGSVGQADICNVGIPYGRCTAAQLPVSTPGKAVEGGL